MPDDLLPYPPCQNAFCSTRGACGACGVRECCAAMFGGGGNKIKWPELVGVDALIAKSRIESQYKLVTVLLVPPNGFVLDDFCCNRVYVHHDQNNLVVQPPLIG